MVLPVTALFGDGAADAELLARLDAELVAAVARHGWSAIGVEGEAEGTDIGGWADGASAADATSAADALRRELAGEGRREEASRLAERLASARGAEAVLVVGVLRVDTGYLLTAALTGRPNRLVLGRVGASLDYLAPLFTAMLSRFVADASASLAPELVTFEAPSASLGEVRLAVSERLLGVAPALTPGPPASRRAEPSAVEVALDVESPPPAPAPSRWQSPWLWTGLGAAVVAGAVGMAMSFDRPTKVVRAPDELRLSLESYR